MNIFLISRGYPEKQDPQWGIFEAQQAQALRQLGHRVTILVVDCRARFYFRKFGIRHLKEDGVYVYYLFPFKILGLKSLMTKANQWMIRRLFRKVVRREGNPDIVYSHYLNLMLGCLPLKKEFDGPIIGLEHWSELLKDNMDPWVNKTALYVYPQMDHVLAVSPALSKRINEHYGVEAKTVPNMVNPAFIKAAKEFNRHTPFRFCTVARLVKLKNLDVLVKAAGILRDRGLDFSLKIAGTGDELKNLSNLISKLELTAKVSLLGRLDSNGIVDLMAESDAFVLASARETFGVVFIEAMAMGLPVIAGDNGGPKDIVNESNGILVPPGDVDALADAMQKMMENYEDYDHKAIARECEAKYSPVNVARQIENIFVETIGKR